MQLSDLTAEQRDFLVASLEEWQEYEAEVVPPQARHAWTAGPMTGLQITKVSIPDMAWKPPKNEPNAARPRISGYHVGGPDGIVFFTDDAATAIDTAWRLAATGHEAWQAYHAAKLAADAEWEKAEKAALAKQ